MVAAQVVTVFGGSGFLGRQIVKCLATEGAEVRIAVRRPHMVRPPKDLAEIARIVPLRADVRDQSSLAEALAGSRAAVNAVSAYVEKGGVTFAAVHEDGAQNVARQTAAAELERLVHISGIGADADHRSRYMRSRGRGEELVREAFPDATILRPSAMFGPGDALFTTLAGLARSLSAVPMFGAGETRLQPVYVGDVALAVARVLADPSAAGKTYELAGPTVYTMRELIKLVLRETGRRRPLVPIPFFIAEAQARLFEMLPTPPLTVGQVELLKEDNVASEAAPGFRDLGITPRSAEDVIPTYIKHGGEARSVREIT
jgi:NADH dehydrogenase